MKTPILKSVADSIGPLALSLIVSLLPLSAYAQTNATAAKADKKAPAAEEETVEYNNWVTLGYGHFFVDGDKYRFQAQKQVPANSSGGIEDLHLEQTIGKKGLIQVDGQGIYDNQDYGIKVDVRHPDIGYVRAGFREFRTWYDPSGGYNSQSNRWVSPLSDALYVNRGDAFVEAGLTLPDWPVFTISYNYQFREGQKDSTTWGDTVARTGANGTRGIVPTFLGIDEKRHIIAGDMKHTIGGTDFGVGLRYDLLDQDNSRNIHRTPGNAATDRFVTQKESVHSDMFNVHGFSETRFNDQWLFTVGCSYSRLDTDVGGSRIFGGSYDPVYDPSFVRRQQRDEGFFDLSGGSLVNQYVVNLNLMYTPAPSWTIVPSIRIEKQDQDGSVNFMETAVQGAPGFLTQVEDLNNSRKRSFIDVTESLEVRYTGFTNWSLYVRGEWVEGQGDLHETERDAGTGVVNLQRDSDNDRLVQKYVAGANWYPLRKLNFSGQYYYKVRANDYQHNVDPTQFRVAPVPGGTNISDFYPAFIRVQNFDTHDMNFRVTWRPLNNLTLVSRYDFQLSTIDTQGDTFTNGTRLAQIQSSEMTTHIFSESISWTPLPRLYTQASISYVLDQTDNPANDIVVANAGNPAGVLVLPSKNNYWNLNAIVGYALSDTTDIQADYFYYRANNYIDNSAVSQPYGAGAEQHGITGTLSQRLSKNLLWKLRYGYYTNRDQTSGGYNNYTAHLVYSSLQYRF